MVSNFQSTVPDEILIMKILSLPFVVLNYFGIWEPIGLTYYWKKLLYRLFTAFVLYTLYTFTASLLIEVIYHLFKRDGIPESLYLLVTTLSGCYKSVIFLTKKRRIISLGGMLLNDHCTPGDAQEIAIHNRYNKVNRYVTGMGLFLVYSNIILMAMTPMTSNARTLPHKAWLPYSIEDPRNYWLSYKHQIFGLIICGSINAAVDNIITGFMWQACAQFDILEYRLKILPGLARNIKSEQSLHKSDQFQRTTLVRAVQHHDYIYLYVKNLTTTFSSIIFVQFCASAAVITISTYQLSVTNTVHIEFLKVLLYLIIMLVEFMMYCWFGNEVHFKSIQFGENVYRSDWNSLNLESRKMLLFIIFRSSKSIFISSYNMVFLSLNTFVHILKLSYSAYNVLRHTSK